MSTFERFDDYERIQSTIGMMISEIQLIAERADLMEDGQYCTHLLVDSAYHLIPMIKWELLSASSSFLKMNDIASALDSIDVPTDHGDPDIHEANCDYDCTDDIKEVNDNVQEKEEDKDSLT